ncbi:DUF1275 family protein [Pseudooceanicola sp. CBS1P-1]|uniref:DUF1275 domain-containing protein n=1 Tax=Pseudooceanicola albus TaxID=2692189 RepID=A0A6L7G5V4_9RHOB|nr:MULTISPECIES: DUF1275 family protein [Pseudooceanicola]MBT9385421.1 DUF1275 family protein [Pseudooceanicola endophyticus]MXN18720.1 DUF1275 domain-containing protein [Pseudooceanicola albus]
MSSRTEAPRSGAALSAPSVPTLLSLNAGYVDTAGFLMLQGLFTAHVTGNFVTIGSVIANGSSGLVAKLLALPVFCVTILAVQALALRLGGAAPRHLRRLLLAETVLLILGGAAAIGFGSDHGADSAPMILAGMLLVTGMAIQNATQKLHLSSAPPTTMMTGTTTQLMLDLGSLMSGRGEAPEVVKPRLLRMLTAVVVFAIGCAAAALAVTSLGFWAFALPPLVTLRALWVQVRS